MNTTTWHDQCPTHPVQTETQRLYAAAEDKRWEYSSSLNTDRNHAEQCYQAARLIEALAEQRELTEALEQAFSEKCVKFDWQWFYRDTARPDAQQQLKLEAIRLGFELIYEQYRIRAKNPYRPIVMNNPIFSL